MSLLCLHILITKRDFFEETIKIVVGKGEKKEIINVPKGRLCAVSAKACSDGWKSGRDGIVELGQMLLTSDFKNAVVDLIIKSYRFNLQKCDCLVGASRQQICKIYGNTTKGSQLRSSLLYTLIANGPPDGHYEDFEHLLYESSREFEEYLLEYTIYTRRYVVGRSGRHKATWETNRCDYHDHPGKPSTCSCTEEF
jgi:hypothetical protein